MRVEVPLGGADRNYNSIKSRAQSVNALIETNTDGTYRRIRRTSGLTQFATPGLGPIRAIYSLKNFAYIVSRYELYRVDSLGNSTLLGNVGGTTELAKINANGTDENEIIIISDGNGYLYDDIGGFRQITDPDFEADRYVASLNQIFWVNKPDSNVFIGSATADGDSWEPTRLASAEQSPDPLVGIIATKTNLWLMGTKTCEYWQTDTTDATVPVRPVAGATVERGVGAKDSIAQFQDMVFWLADDFTVWQIKGNGAQKISDLNLEYAIRGEGYGDNQGYLAPDRAEGFFIDHPTHKMYVLTFPVDKQTWVYDVSTGLWHKRESNGIGRWRGRESAIAFGGKILIGDYRDGIIWQYDESAFNENGDIMKYQVVTPPISDDQSDIYINHIEVVMEVGVGGISALDAFGVLKDTPRIPRIKVEYSKNGGVTFNSVPETDLSVGAIGERELKVITRLTSSLVRRSSNFVMRFTITDDVQAIMYSLICDIEKGM